MANKVNRPTLERLSFLELRKYAGDLNAIKGPDLELHNQLLESPIEVRLIASEGICENELYDICSVAQGEYKKFIDLRTILIQNYSDLKEYSKKIREIGKTSLCLVTVLFSGIYIGDPEDVLHFKENKPKKILYPTKGLGSKIAEINFL